MFKKIILALLLLTSTTLSQPPYFPPASSDFGTRLNSYGFPGTSTMMDCYSRTSSMEQYYNSFGYHTRIGFQGTSNTNANHIYLFVQDPSSSGWAAVDPYFGYIESPSNYYTPDAFYSTWNDYDSSRSRMMVQ